MSIEPTFPTATHGAALKSPVRRLHLMTRLVLLALLVDEGRLEGAQVAVGDVRRGVEVAGEVSADAEVDARVYVLLLL